MKPEHQAWIDRNVPNNDGYGQCQWQTVNMQKAFPDLERVCGLYLCPFWGERTHWWLKEKDGTIVDPTAGQFPSKGIGVYRELSEEEAAEKVPVCPCMECGQPVYKANYISSGFCSVECADAFRLSLLS